MLFWLTALMMMVGSVLLILIPLARRFPDQSIDEQGAAFYRHQLQELDDRISGGAEDNVTLEAERTEVARRLIKEAELTSNSATKFKRSRTPVVLSSIMALLGVPVATFVIYAAVGQPEKLDVPLQEQQALAPAAQQSAILVARVEEILKKNPDDTRGWEVLANYYQSSNQPTEAVRALRNIERVNGASSRLTSRIGALITMANKGVITEEAKRLFQQALQQDPTDRVAKSHIAVAFEQEGRKTDALKMWRELRASVPEESQGAKYSNSQINRLEVEMTSGKQPAIDPEAQAAITSLPEDERSALIQGMVGRLAERLTTESGTVEEWSRLVRSYVVLKNRPKAIEYLTLAETSFASSSQDLKVLEALAETLNLKASVKP